MLQLGKKQGHGMLGLLAGGAGGAILGGQPLLFQPLHAAAMVSLCWGLTPFLVCSR